MEYYVGLDVSLKSTHICVKRWLCLSEQFRAFFCVDFRLDYAAAIIGASALK